MGQENLLGYMLSSLFTQNKVAKGCLFMTGLEKDSRPLMVKTFLVYLEFGTLLHQSAGNEVC